MMTSEPGKRYVLRIYNADQSRETAAIAERLAEALKTHVGEGHSVEVVDILSEPDRASEDRVFVTPTLIKELPEPTRRLIGDLSDPQQVLLMLGVVCEKPE